LVLDGFILEPEHWVVKAAELLNSDACGLLNIFEEIAKHPKEERDAKLTALQRLFKKELKRRDIKLYAQLSESEGKLLEYRKQVAARVKAAKKFRTRLCSYVDRFREHHKPFFSFTYTKITDEPDLSVLYKAGMPYGDRMIDYSKVKEEYEIFKETHGVSNIFEAIRLVDEDVGEETQQLYRKAISSHIKEREEAEYDAETRRLEEEHTKMMSHRLRNRPGDWQKDLAHAEEWYEFLSTNDRWRTGWYPFVEGYLVHVYGISEFDHPLGFRDHKLPNPVTFNKYLDEHHGYPEAPMDFWCFKPKDWRTLPDEPTFYDKTEQADSDEEHRKCIALREERRNKLPKKADLAPGIPPND
jgi:hypothetical protein